MKKHFVTFYSPGTFISETTIKEIDSWDVDTAMKMARSIKERYNATPYGFSFSTRTCEETELDSHVSDTSGMYFLGGSVETLEEIKKRKDPSDEILISNMEINKWDRVIVNTNSWKITLPLGQNDRVLEWENEI
jgi:hypothetical protein